MSGPGFEQALDRIKAREADALVVASTDILTVDEVVRIIRAGGVVAFAREDLWLEGTVTAGKPGGDGSDEADGDA